MGAAIIAGMNTSPVFEVAEHKLDPVTLAMKGFVLRTNLSVIRFAAELWLGKPVIAINTATYGHALRANGLTDRMPGFGRLMSEF